jgi:hypothetical protein
MIAAMRRLLTIALLLGGVHTHAASAQTGHSLEVSGGYSLARDPRDQLTMPTGWMAGAAVGVTDWLAGVADVSGQYKTVPLVGSDAKLSVETVLAGARASGRIGRLTEFGQVLAGVVRASGSAYGSTIVSYSLGIQPGVGLDVPLAGAFAARAELDVRLVRGDQETSSPGYQLRFVGALVYRRERR